MIRKFTPKFLLHYYHFLLAFLGAVWYRFPAQKLIVIGVTGTSGKSTTVDFITRILEENGDRVASISSVRFRIAGGSDSTQGSGVAREWKNDLKMTMPGRFKIQKFLRQAVEAKCKYVVIEVTSEGIKQFRHKFINLKTAVFNNLSPEHIESHGGFENYRNAKLKLFLETKNTHVINIDDQNAKYFLEILADKKITFGLTGDADIKATQINNLNGINFEVSGVKFNVNVLGDFNVYNALASISVAVSEGISLAVCQKALEKVTGIAGRMEVVLRQPLVVVDYAHTPDQLEKVYQTLSQPENSKLICVLGSCGGGRDKWKRPVLGQIAQKYCQEIIITNEDPYDEDPLEIMEQVAGGIDNQVKNYNIVLDRSEAIKKALGLVKNNEIVIITGKGSEVWMCLASGKKIPWSDKNVVLESLLVPKS